MKRRFARAICALTFATAGPALASEFPAPYCGFTADYDVEPITRVSFRAINDRTTSYADVADLLHLNAEVHPGQVYDIVLEGDTVGPYTNYFRVFIDWNQNSAFDSDHESYLAGTIHASTGDDDVFTSTTIEVPADALLGATRMRVVKNYDEYGDACGVHNYGQAKDYSITVAAPSATSPELLSPIENQSGTVGSAFTLDVAAHFSDPQDDTLSFSAAGLPPGLILGAGSGVISGTLTGFGEYRVTVTATNTGAESASTSFTLSIDFEREPFAGGDGSASDPWQITSASQLHAVRDDLAAHYVLAADIDLGTAPWNLGAGWLPIGDEDEEFRGGFDGNGYVISGLTIDRPDEDNVGLFGALFFATLDDIRLEDVSVSGAGKTGALAGEAGASTITSIFVSGSITAAAGTEYVGGLLGSAGYTTTISDVSADVHVAGGDYVGGLVGELVLSSEIHDAHVRGVVTGAHYAVGGLVGDAQDSLIERSHAHADVSGGMGVGGLLGYGVEAVVTESHAEGKVHADDVSAGGLVGILSWYSTVSDSYARGEVTTAREAGGLIGSVVGSMVENSYAAAAVSGTPPLGGLVGYVYEATVRDSFWNTAFAPGLNGIGQWDESGDYPNSVENVAGLSADDVGEGTAFSNAGWDLDNVWLIDPASGQIIHHWAADEIGAAPIPLPDQYLLVGEIVSLDLAAPFGGMTGEILRFTATGLPEDLRFNEDTAQLSGSMSAAGTHVVTVTAHFADAGTASLDVRLVSLNFAGGSGSEADPWRIATADQLDQIRHMLHGHFQLAADIDLGGGDPGSPYYNAGAGWLPIGDFDAPFSGALDGDGHVITGLFIDGDADANGLFGWTSDAEIRNLHLEAVDVRGGDYTGALVGWLEGGNLVNVHVSGTVALATEYALGGGLVGAMLGGEIAQSHFEGLVTTPSAGGGLVGDMAAGRISDSYARGAIDTMIGGGLVGLLNEGSEIVRGYAGTAVNAVLAGGLAGYVVQDALSVNASFWDKTAAPGLDAFGVDEEGLSPVPGLDAAVLRDRTTFTDAGWDFDTVWNIRDAVNDGLPYLRGEGRVVANVPPTFSSLSGPLGPIAEDTTLAFDFAAIAALGDQEDAGGGATEGGIAGFAVKGVTSGTLSINGQPFDPATHYLIDAAAAAAWTPPANAHGLLDAFTLVAVDDEGARSATSVQAQVQVTPVNDAPSLLTPIPAQGAVLGSGITLDVSAHFGDLDGDTLSFSATGLPPGLAIDATGLIAGVPTARGEFEVFVTASDVDLLTASAAFVLTVDTAPSRARVINNEQHDGSFSGQVVVTATGVLHGGRVNGYVRNSGLVTGALNLGPGSTIDGGTVSGSISGNAGNPARIVNAVIAPGTRLENVIIGRGTALPPGVVIGANVRFDDGAAIPPGIDLSAALAPLNWNSGDGRPVANLDDDVETAPQLPLIRAIQLLTPFEPSGNGIEQNASGELLLVTQDARSAALPVLVSQAQPDAEEGVYVNENGDIVFITANRRVVVSHPVLVDNAFFVEVMRAMGLNVTFNERTNLVATPDTAAQGDVLMLRFLSVGEDNTTQSKAGYYHTARPALSALPAHRHQREGLHTHAFARSPSLQGLSLVFRDETGRLMEQDIVPMPADWPGLKDYLLRLVGVSEARIDAEGVITVVQEGRVIQGRAGFRVTKGVGRASEDGRVTLRVAGDLNGDGQVDYWVVYPNGDRQNLFILP